MIPSACYSIRCVQKQPLQSGQHMLINRATPAFSTRYLTPLLPQCCAAVSIESCLIQLVPPHTFLSLSLTSFPRSLRPMPGQRKRAEQRGAVLSINSSRFKSPPSAGKSLIKYAIQFDAKQRAGVRTETTAYGLTSPLLHKQRPINNNLLSTARSSQQKGLSGNQYWSPF